MKVLWRLEWNSGGAAVGSGFEILKLFLVAGLIACGGEETGSTPNPSQGQQTGGTSGFMPPAAGTPAMMMPPVIPTGGTMSPPMAGTMPAPMAGTMAAPMAGTMAEPTEDASVEDSGMVVDATMPDAAVVDAGPPTPGEGMCCDDGDCLCHGDPPSSLTGSRGPYDTDSYSVSGAGCVHYPTDAEPPFAAVAISDGFLGSGGCSSFQTGQWGPLYASWGIVAMIINTTGSDQPSTRGRKLTGGIAAFKQENQRSGSPLYQKLAGRYGTSGFSMGGGGTTFSAADDPSLLTNIAIMPYGPTRETVMVPTLVICGSSDGTAPCSTHGTPFYGRVPDSVPKMRITVSSGHSGQPSAGRSASGEAGLAFQKVYLEGDERWRDLLLSVDATASNID